MNMLISCVLFLFCNYYSVAEDFGSVFHPTPRPDDAIELRFALLRHFQPTPEYIVLEKPQITIVENFSGLAVQCPLMKGNYLSLWHEYAIESSQLVNLLDQNRGASPDLKGDRLPQLHEMQIALKKTIDELNRLVLPEWSQESLRVRVRWSLPESTLLIIPEDDPDTRDGFLTKSQASFLVSKGLSVKPGFSDHALNSLKALRTKARFDGLSFHVNQAQYMGQGTTALIPYLRLESREFTFEETVAQHRTVTVNNHDFEFHEERNLIFDYEKPMTWVEYCQLTQTAEFSVDVGIKLSNFGGAHEEKRQKFSLRSR